MMFLYSANCLLAFFSNANYLYKIDQLSYFYRWELYITKLTVIFGNLYQKSSKYIYMHILAPSVEC